MNNNQAKMIILDRDGTLIKSIPYLHDSSLVELLPGAGDNLRFLSNYGFTFVIATNQSAVGRNFATISEVESTNLRVIQLLLEFEVRKEKVIFCPHAPSMYCLCRKPKPGMGIELIKQFKSKKKNTMVIGDQITDIEFASALGVKSILFSNQPHIKGLPITTEICSSWDEISQTVIRLMTL
jgi:D-glycero-D-manno-heptose 1,7-bisphosphate phosphatase